jgi:hypothetical protein
VPDGLIVRAIGSAIGVDHSSNLVACIAGTSMGLAPLKRPAAWSPT